MCDRNALSKNVRVFNDAIQVGVTPCLDEVNLGGFIVLLKIFLTKKATALLKDQIIVESWEGSS